MRAILRASVGVSVVVCPPQVNLSRDISHKRKVYLQQHDRMLEAFQNESFWPEDIRTALLQSDTMTFFYNTSVPA